MALGNSCPAVLDDKIKSYGIEKNTYACWYIKVLTSDFAPKNGINVFVMNQVVVRDLDKIRL